MSRYVYDFSEGNKDLKDLLGGKGANLAEMTRIGLPVPPGFTISTDACRAYLGTGAVPDGLLDEVQWWRTDDLWYWSLEALAAYVRAAADRSGQSVESVCRRLASTRDVTVAGDDAP